MVIYVVNSVPRWAKKKQKKTKQQTKSVNIVTVGCRFSEYFLFIKLTNGNTEKKQQTNKVHGLNERKQTTF